MAAVDQEHVHPQQQALSKRPKVAQHFTSLDRAVIVVIVLLIGLISATILLGDRVGVLLTQISPLGDAHSTSDISIRFNEAMDHDSVSAHFHIEPALQGALSWSGSTLTFKPAAALKPGSAYTVLLEP